MERPVNYKLPASDCVGASLFPEQTRRRSRWLYRRLITLIFADRARRPAVMVVIRRELPRTSIAHSAIGLSHRSVEDPPFRGPLDRPLIGSIFIMGGSDSGGLRRAPRRSPVLLLHVHPDGPDEAQQLARHRGDHLLLGLALADQPAIAAVQAVLRLPGDRLDLLAQPGLALQQLAAHRRPVPVRPGRLPDDAPHGRVAGLGDGAPPDPLATRVLPGHSAAVSHQLPRIPEPRLRPHLA